MLKMIKQSMSVLVSALQLEHSIIPIAPPPSPQLKMGRLRNKILHDAANGINCRAIIKARAYIVNCMLKKDSILKNKRK